MIRGRKRSNTVYPRPCGRLHLDHFFLCSPAKGTVCLPVWETNTDLCVRRQTTCHKCEDRKVREEEKLRNWQ